MFKKKAATRAVAMVLTASAATLGVPALVLAQSNTTGNIQGVIEAPTGAEILIEAANGGFRRSVQPGDLGRFQALSLPVGDYRVSLVRNGVVERTVEVSVSISGTATVSFAAERINITGRNSRIDVSNTNSGAVFTAKQLERLPVANNLGAVMMLAPQAVASDPRYGGTSVPSFGGASASENAYYINGFPVTNALLQIGYSSLPFGAMNQMQILEGGYGAEFGRSTGGVVNITTKRGGNQWQGNLALQWSPDALRASERDSYYKDNPDRLRYYNSDNTFEQRTVTADIGGALIKDRLYIYLAAEQTDTDAEESRSTAVAAFNSTAGWQVRKVKAPKLLAKLDWNITDHHHLEYTAIRDEPSDDRTFSGVFPATRTHNAIRNGGVHYESYNATTNGLSATKGGNVDILKYTGQLTDQLTLTAVLGKGRTDQVGLPVDYDESLPYITVIDVPAGISPESRQNTLSVLTPGAFYETRGERIDLEWRVNDAHTLRFGFDNNELKALGGTSSPVDWRYDSQNCAQPLPGPAAPLPPTNFQNGNTCYYVYKALRNTVSAAQATQAAQYVEDRWQVTDRLMLALGLRNEQFANKNGEGKTFVEQTRQIEPRIGAAYDLDGDGRTKLFGNLGRYHMQLPTNVALRGAGATLFIDQYFSYTGVDPATGAPTGTVALDAPYAPNGETGQPKQISYIAATNIDAHAQDELALGIERAFNPALNGGFKLTYRKLNNAIDDFCDPRPFDTWAANHGNLDTTYFHQKWSCATFNPGSTAKFRLDIDGDGTAEDITLTPEDMANGLGVFPKPKRTYLALDFYLEHPFDGKWYGKVNYTWSRLRGNQEGQLNSDFGQADPGATLIADHFELTQWGNGRLPNDRRHVLKAQGYYVLDPQWSFGGNLLYSSGRPLSSIGDYCGPVNILGDQDYGAYFCHDGAPSPRGTAGEMSSDLRIDLNATWRPSWLPGVTLRADVFNVFDKQVPVQVRQLENPGNLYHSTEAFSTPRSVRFTAQYSYRF